MVFVQGRQAWENAEMYNCMVLLRLKLRDRLDDINIQVRIILKWI
jgi:hypothetical protein